MKNTLTQFIPYLIAVLLAIISCLLVVAENSNASSSSLYYSIPNSVLYGLIVLAIVGLTILFKGHTWKYLFLFAIILSFFPFLDFALFGFAFYIGILKIDLIAIPLLIGHIAVNSDTLRIRSKSEVDQIAEESANIDFLSENLRKSQKKNSSKWKPKI